MNEDTKLVGRIEAIEFLLTTVIADAISTQPDPGRSLTTFRDFCIQKAQTLKAEAAFAGEPDGWQSAAFADALADRTKQPS